MPSSLCTRMTVALTYAGFEKPSVRVTSPRQSAKHSTPARQIEAKAAVRRQERRALPVPRACALLPATAKTREGQRRDGAIRGTRHLCAALSTSGQWRRCCFGCQSCGQVCSQACRFYFCGPAAAASVGAAASETLSQLAAALAFVEAASAASQTASTSSAFSALSPSPPRRALLAAAAWQDDYPAHSLSTLRRRGWTPQRRCHRTRCRSGTCEFNQPPRPTQR